MKKFNYERPQVSIVDYELDRNIADTEHISVQGVEITVSGEGVTFP